MLAHADRRLAPRLASPRLPRLTRADAAQSTLNTQVLYIAKTLTIKLCDFGFSKYAERLSESIRFESQVCAPAIRFDFK